MSEYGWIQLHRELLNKPIWQSSRAEQKVIIITLLLLANHTEKEWIFEGKRYICKPGQFVTSLSCLSDKSGTSIRSVRTALDNFEKIHQFLTNKSTNKNRLITITNWELYQTNTQVSTNKPTSNRQATDKQPTTNNNVNKDNNDNKIPTVRQAEISRIVAEYQKYLNDHNVERQKEVLDYLDKGLSEDVITECIRDATTGDQPCKYVFGILNRCVTNKIFNLQQYIDAKKEHEKARRKQLQQQTKTHNNFDQREYPEEFYDQFYVNLSKEE